MKAIPLAIDYFSKKTKHEFHLPLSVFKKPKNNDEYMVLEKILVDITTNDAALVLHH